MNTIPELLAFLRARSKDDSMAAMLQKVEDFQLAREYVNDRVSDVHVVRTFNKASKRWVVGLVSSAVSLDKRGLLAVKSASAAQKLGRSFAYDNAQHPFCVWAIDAYLSAAAHIKALEVVQGVA
jgi:hypothetical protein